MIENCAWLGYHKSNMNIRADERGALNVLLIPVILLSVLFVSAAAFGAWAFSKSQDYKNNVDAKVAVAVTANKAVVQAADAKTYAEAAKQPLMTYAGPEAYGSVHISYPKTWSLYVSTPVTSSGLPNNYFNPVSISSLSDSKSIYALRMQVLGQSYASVVNSFADSVKSGKTAVAPYTLSNVPNVIGIRADGLLNNGETGSMVVFPIRDKTLEIWTESATYVPDFNDTILPKVTFSP